MIDPLESVWMLELLKYLVAACGLGIGIIYMKLAIRYKRYTCAIPKWILSFLGFYWCGYYVRSILDVGISSHQVWVRSPLFVTLAAILFMGILSLWRLEK